MRPPAAPAPSAAARPAAGAGERPPGAARPPVRGSLTRARPPRTNTAWPTALAGARPPEASRPTALAGARSPGASTVWPTSSFGVTPSPVRPLPGAAATPLPSAGAPPLSVADGPGAGASLARVPPAPPTWPTHACNRRRHLNLPRPAYLAVDIHTESGFRLHRYSHRCPLWCGRSRRLSLCGSCLGSPDRHGELGGPLA